MKKNTLRKRKQNSLCQRDSNERKTNNNERKDNNDNKKEVSSSNKSVILMNKKGNETMPIRIGLEDTDVPVKDPVHNAIHQNCIKNMDIMNYHPQNNINTSTKIVALQILMK